MPINSENQYTDPLNGPQDAGSVPTVSVIVPAYNVERFLPGLFDIMRRQTLSDWELILVDDCSKDGTYAKAAELTAGDSRFRILRRKENSGSAYVPRMEACRIARAELVCPLDADDSVTEDYLEKMVARLRETEAYIIFPLMINGRARADGNREIFRRDLLDPDRIYAGRELVRHTLNGWSFGCNGGLYRRGLYQEALEALRDLNPAEPHLPVSRPLSRNPFIDETGTRALLIAAPKVGFELEAEYFYAENEQSVVRDSKAHYLLVESQGWLRSLIDSHFPAGSEERRRLDLQTIGDLAAALGDFRRLRKSYDPEERRELWRLLKHAWERIPWRRARSVLTPRFRIALAFGPRVASLFFALKHR